jgi:hypothetical protein
MLKRNSAHKTTHTIKDTLYRINTNNHNYNYIITTTIYVNPNYNYINYNYNYINKKIIFLNFLFQSECCYVSGNFENIYPSSFNVHSRFRLQKFRDVQELNMDTVVEVINSE